LQPWLDAAQEKGVPEMQRFAAGLVWEQAAVQAALEEPWSTGLLEARMRAAA
jgi:transposase